MEKIIVVGGNFAGIAVALETKRLGRDKVEVILVDKTSHFLFMPSLIWVPFGRREIADIQVSRKEVLESCGISFIQSEALMVNPISRTLITSVGEMKYDQLVIATGPKVNFDIAPGIREYAHYIGNPQGALRIRETLQQFKQHPGPVVIGASQGAGCMGAAYEFLFNFEKWCREQGIREKVDLHWITPEPYLGHFGMDGIRGGNYLFKKFFKMFHITPHTEVGVVQMDQKEVTLTDGTQLPYSFSMIMPQFLGVDFIRNSPELHASPTGFIGVGNNYRHPEYTNLWAAGLAVSFSIPWKAGKVPFVAPKTGFPSELSGKIVARNIIKAINGEGAFIEKYWGNMKALCIMDCGKKEVLIVGDHLFKPRHFALMLPNLFHDFSKVSFEKYFLWKTRKGFSFLP